MLAFFGFLSPTAPGRDPFPTSGPVPHPAAVPAACRPGAVSSCEAAVGPLATATGATATGATATGATAVAPPGTPSSGLGAVAAGVLVT